MQKENRYNPFNGMKALAHINYWIPILEGKIPPPIFVSLDLCSTCNLKCEFCNAEKSKGHTKMSKETMDVVCDVLKYQWNTKAVCIGGGGDSSLNENLPYMVDKLYDFGIKIGLITNGVNIKNLGDLSKYEWIGISVDSVSRETFTELKGSDKFDTVIKNIKYLTSQHKTNITFKYLIHPKNRFEVYWAIELAKELGCDRIHIRPGSYSWFDKNRTQFEFDENDYFNIEKQVNEGINEFKDDNFDIYYVPIKFNEQLKPITNFSKCYANYVSCTIYPNGIITLCCDKRGDKSMELGHIKDCRKIWGGNKHINIVNSIDVTKCPRCTMSHVNEIFENVIIKDKMLTYFI
jgi:MoaA/NifB/PqqE/SkfB family radical SAM enzyme